MAAAVFSLALWISVCGADNSPLSQLRQEVFFGYDKNVMPTKREPNDGPLEVLFGVAPRWMDLDSAGLLTASLWLRMVWSDFRLSWEPAHLQNITVLRINPREIWQPDVALYNKQDLNNGILAADSKSSTSNALLYHDGRVVWVTPVSHKVMCEGVTYVNWPWGVQECNLKFGSWSFDGTSFDLKFHGDKHEMDMSEFEQEANQFEILSNIGRRNVKTYACCSEPYVDLNFKFSLKRKYMVDPTLGRIDNPEP